MSVTIAGSDGGLRATFVPELGMLCAAVEVDGRERLDPRRGVEAYREQGKTMGIPLLYPWANRLAGREFKVAGRSVRLPAPGTTIGVDEHGLPLHGAQPRLMRWTAAEDGPALQAELDWRDPDLLAIFPFAHSVAYEATAGPGAELRISVTVRADGEDRVPVAFGLHPYLRLPPDGRDCVLDVPASVRLATDERGIPNGKREPLPAGALGLHESWDDGMPLGSLPVVFAVEGRRETIAVELLDGFTHGQLFSPDGAGFVCFEPMTAPVNALVSGDGLRVLAPGQSLRTSFRLTWTSRAQAPLAA